MKLLSILTLAVLSALTLSTSASADPSFDSDCVGAQWVIRNHSIEPFAIATADGEVVMAVDAIWEPGDNLDSVIIANTVIVRPSCEVLAPPAPTRLPATGTSPILAVLALVLVAAGATAWRVGRN